VTDGGADARLLRHLSGREPRPLLRRRIRWINGAERTGPRARHPGAGAVPEPGVGKWTRTTNRPTNPARVTSSRAGWRRPGAGGTLPRSSSRPTAWVSIGPGSSAGAATSASSASSTPSSTGSTTASGVAARNVSVAASCADAGACRSSGAEVAGSARPRSSPGPPGPVTSGCAAAPRPGTTRAWCRRPCRRPLPDLPSSPS